MRKIDLYPDGGYIIFGFESYWRYGAVDNIFLFEPHSIHGTVLMIKTMEQMLIDLKHTIESVNENQDRGYN
jgi:hypothetical protein